jgi:hypothetical protein
MIMTEGKEYSVQDERRAMKQSRVRNKSPEFTTMLATQSHIVPIRIANDDFDPDNVEEATNAYKSTMRNLQRPSEQIAAPPKKEKKKRAMSPGPRTALIPSELDVHEDWMIGDSQVVVAPSYQANQATDQSKKRQQVNQEKRLGKQKEILPVSSSSPLLFPSQSSDTDSEDSSEPRSRRNRYKSPPPPLPRCLRDTSSSSSGSSLSSSDDEGVEKVERHYISDKESIRYKSPPPPVQRSVLISSSSSEEQGDDDEVMFVEESRAAKMPSPAPSLPSNKTNKQESSTRDALRLKIQILGNVLLVPVDGSNRSRSIEWLCDQTSSRYAQ